MGSSTGESSTATSGVASPSVRGTTASAKRLRTSLPSPHRRATRSNFPREGTDCGPINKIKKKKKEREKKRETRKGKDGDGKEGRDGKGRTTLGDFLMRK